MAKRIGSNESTTLTAVADATNIADSTYPFAILGGSTTQVTNIIEFYMGGMSAASATTFTLLAFDSQIATGSLTKDASLTDGPMHAATAALAAPPTVFNKAATNKPQRSASLHLMNLSFNAFGGVVRWVAAPGEEVTIVGNAASLGQVSLSAFTGGSGIVGSHVIFETF